MQKVFQWVERHPLVSSILSFVVGFMPGWIGSIWSLFSDEPLAQVVAVWLGTVEVPTVTVLSWLMRVLAILMFGVVVYVVVRARRRIKVVKKAIKNVTAIPREEKGLLDFGAGIEEAIIEHATVLNLLNSDVRRLGRIANRNVRRVQSATSLTKKKRRTERVAKKIDGTSTAMEPRIVRLEHSANLLHENLTGFVELCDEPEVLKLFYDNTVALRENVPEAIAGMTTFHITTIGLRKDRINRALSEVFVGLEGRVERILRALKTVLRACDDTMVVIDRKRTAR